MTGDDRDPKTPPEGTATASTSPGVFDELRPTRPLVYGPAEGSGEQHHHGDAPPVFADDSLIAGRYRIVRFVARGGGGEVYEADDRELGGRVALKTVDPLADERKTERFRREIQLARRVTHPNACRIYDVGHHDTGERDIRFLTMEFLEGINLAFHLARRGPLPLPEAAALARQMAAGLDAAHRAGVVHRDFKSSNVMLVPDADQPGGVRAVVTDFGLARSGRRDSAELRTMTGEGAVVGTPAYMAPEQVAGDQVGAPADIYAFGVVLFEMVTGALPFQGESVLSTAVKRLREPPPSPRLHRPDLEPDWERAILRCLALRPADRFPTAGAAVAAAVGLPDSGARRISPRRLALAAGVLALALALAGALFWAGRRSPPSAETAPPASAAPAPPGAPRTAVAVLGFSNLSGRPESAWLSTALSEMLATELAASDRLRTIPGETVARMTRELQLADAVSLAADSLARIRNHLGSDYVVLGSYTALADGQLRLDLRLQDTAAGRDLPAISLAGTETGLFGLVEQAGRQLRASLGASGSAAGLAAVRSSPRNPEAARLYAEGLDRFRRFDFLTARTLLERAAAAEPEFPLAHVALAEAWQRLGYDSRARAAAERAFALAGPLRREERLLVEGRFRETARDWERAIEIRRELWRDYPDDFEHGLRLARTLLEANQPQEVLHLAEELARRPPPAGNDPNIGLIEAEAAIKLSEYARAAAAARRAAQQGAALGSGLAVAAAGLQESQALLRLGDPAAALLAADAAHRGFAAAGDLSGAARALRARARVLRSQGELEPARRATEQALAGSRKVGELAAIAAALNTLGNLAYEQGQLAEAERRYQEVLAAMRDAADQHGIAAALGNLGNARLLIGDPRGAIAAQEEALAIKRRLAFPSGIAASLIGLGSAELERGDLATAAAHLNEALRICQQAEEKSLQAHALFALGEVHRAAGELALALDRQQQAMRLREDLREPGTLADSRVALGALALDRGDPAAAGALARTASAEFAVEGQADGETGAQLLLARAQLAAGDAAGARTALRRAVEISSRGENHGLLIATEIVAARLDAAAGDRPGARRRLEAATRAAAERELALSHGEARLAAAEIEAEGGDGAARARLLQLAAELQERGLGLLAAKAKAAASR